MKIYFALPAMNEAEYIGETLRCILMQKTECNVEVFVCINQPDSCWEIPDKLEVCLNNQRTFEMLKNISENIHIIDRSAKGNGWKGKETGVGQARNTLMNEINRLASPEDIIISIDADSKFDETYVESIVQNFKTNPTALALSTPYYHQLTNDEAANKAILRYEIYMRNYSLNMLRIDSPFAFTALGSAMACRVSAYRKIGEISPMKSGEDFYFLQQLRKIGSLLIWNNSWVYPAARFSDRVFFGTGPAMIKGNQGNWESYPIYCPSFFDEIGETYLNLNLVYSDDFENNFLNFLKIQFKNENFLDPIRKNCKTAEQFVKAFHFKVDGLRILQFLKLQQKERGLLDYECLLKSIHVNIPDVEIGKRNLDEVEHLIWFRDLLHTEEIKQLKKKQILSFS